MGRLNPGNYRREPTAGRRRRKTASFDQALKVIAQERGWVEEPDEHRGMRAYKITLPKLRFLEAPPPELYAGHDWRERVHEWNVAHKRIPLETAA
jgi:hypothetical protein